MSDKPLDQVWVHYDGDRFGPINRTYTEEDVREALTRQAPSAANAEYRQDPETGDWTVTRRAGEKG